MKTFHFIIISSIVLSCITTGCQEEKKSTNATKGTFEKNKSIEDVYTGQYLDIENHEPLLQIYRTSDSTYALQIGIHRLTQIDDGVGDITPQGLSFNATDANGEPIAGTITLSSDTATVTFTSSTWTYLPNGTSFLYYKQKGSDDILNWINAIYATVCFKNYNSDSLASLYCSSDWNKTLHEVQTIDAQHADGTIGFFEYDYWIMAQDKGNASIHSLSIEDLQDTSATMFLDVHNLGTTTHVQLDIVKENKSWKIDDFHMIGAETKDWKQAMKEYCKEN